jgi:hypothetical protein
MRKILNLGVTGETDFVEARQIQVVNFMSFVGAFILLLESTINFSNDDFETRVSEFISCIVLFFNLYLNYKGYKSLAKSVLMVATIFILSYGLSFLGNASGIQFYYIDVVIAVFLIYSIRQWYIASILILIMAATYYSIYYMFEEGVLIPLKDKASLRIDFNVNIVLAGLVSIILLFVFNYIISVTDTLYKKQKADFLHIDYLITNVIDASPNGVWVIDKNYRLMLFNKRYGEFCKLLFNGFQVYKGFAINGHDKTGNENIDYLISKYNKDWLNYYNKALGGETASDLFHFSIQEKEIKVEVTFAPFNVKGYSAGAIMYSRRLS